MEDAPNWLSYMMNGMTIATFIAVMIIFAKVMRWSGKVDTKIEAFESWQRTHMKEQHRKAVNG